MIDFIEWKNNKDKGEEEEGALILPEDQFDNLLSISESLIIPSLKEHIEGLANDKQSGININLSSFIL